MPLLCGPWGNQAGGLLGLAEWSLGQFFVCFKMIFIHVGKKETEHKRRERQTGKQAPRSARRQMRGSFPEP